MLRRDIPGKKYSAYTCDWRSRADAAKDADSSHYSHCRKNAGVSLHDVVVDINVLHDIAGIVAAVRVMTNVNAATADIVEG